MISAPHTTEQLVEGRDELKPILDGVQQLPDDRREALIMRFALGMDNREIARALGPLRRRDQGAASTARSSSSRRSSPSGTPTAPTGRRERVSSGTANFEAPAARGARRRSSRPRTWSSGSRGRSMSITELAADELEAWELSAMRDPRNWVAPRGRVVVGGAAGTALVVLRVRGAPPASASSSRSSLLDLAERTLQRHRRRGAARIAASATASAAAPSALVAAAAAARLCSQMATCYRHPSRETGVSCSNCGRPICPDCMTPTPGRHALPGVRRADAPRSSACATAPALPRVTYALIAINVIVFLAETAAGARCSAAASHGTVVSTKASLYGRSIDPAQPRVLAARHRRLPARRTSSTSRFNMYLLYLLGPMLEPAIGTRASPRSTSPRCWPARSARCCSQPDAEPRRLRRVLRADGRAVVELRARRHQRLADRASAALILINLVFSASASPTSRSAPTSAA